MPGGVSARFRPEVDHGRVRAKLGLSRPYVLTVATADRRKNLEALSVAATRLASEGIDLVWAGDSRPYFSGTTAAPNMRSLGYVDEADLPGLYAGARAFVLPSRYEGFGLPCLEAMACGVPVLAADRAALPETCGSAAVLVDPDDRDRLAQELVRLATTGRINDHLITSGFARAAEFTWERTARETHSVLRDQLAQH